jgi:hypothetical protein
MNVFNSVRTTRYAVFGLLSANLTLNQPPPARRASREADASFSITTRSPSSSMTCSCSRREDAVSSRSLSRATRSRLARLFIVACMLSTWLPISRLTAMPSSSGFSSVWVSTYTRVRASNWSGIVATMIHPARASTQVNASAGQR